MPGKISFIQPNITSLFPGKTPFQEGSFMKGNYLLLISLLIVGALVIPAVSAVETEIFNETYSASFTENLASKHSWQVTQSHLITAYVIGVENIGGTLTSSTVTLPLSSVSNRASLKQSDYWPITITALNSGHYLGTGEMGYYIYKVGTTDYIRIMLFLDDIELTGFATKDIKYNCVYLGISAPPTGSVSPRIAMTEQISITVIKNGLSPDAFILANMVANDDVARMVNTVNVYSTVNYQWQNDLSVIDAGDRSKIFLDRTNEVSGYSVITIESTEGFYTDTGSVDIDTLVPAVNYPFSVNVHNTLADVWYNESFFSSGTPGEPIPTPSTYSVTVYAQNANTGFVIAGTDLNVKNYDTSVWYNSTLEWGWDSIQLPAGNYEFYAEKSGFTQYSPGRLTIDGVDDNIILLLYPDVVAPPAGNLTLQFWVCDTDSNGIPYAELSVLGLAGEGADYDSGIIQTNNLGYATLTAPGNSTYTAYASKQGYTSGENEFGVTTISPVHIAVMLMAGEIPTNPTPTQPGVTPTVTPTVRPTDVAAGNNPIDNFRIMYLNMGFDDTYSDWLTGLFIICLGAVLGFILAKKFGAMCGAPIGLITATGLHLIPIWATVLIIVIVALAYAKFIMGR